MPNHNQYTKHVILQILQTRGWSERRLAKETGINHGQISRHLAGHRQITVWDYKKYVVPFDGHERSQLLLALLREVAGHEVDDLVTVSRIGIKIDMRGWPLDSVTKEILRWWARELMHDSELHDMFMSLSARMGYKNKKRK